MIKFINMKNATTLLNKTISQTADKRILIIDSAKRYSAVISDKLKVMRYSVDVPFSLEDIVDYFEHYLPQLIILDLDNEPELSIKVLRWINHINYKWKVIIVSDILNSGTTNDLDKPKTSSRILFSDSNADNLLSLAERLLNNEYNHTTIEYDLTVMFSELIKPIFKHLAKKYNKNIYQEITSAVEKSLYSTALEYCKKNQVKASALLGVSRNTLRSRVKKYNLY